MGDVVEDVRIAVYDAFRRTGAAPAVDDLARAVGSDADRVRGVLAALDRTRDLVLGDDADRIVMAHPFTAVPLGFSVMGERRLWWGGCAWDSFAIPHLLGEEPSVLVATTCPGCGRALAWVVDTERPPDGAEVAHFLTPAAHIWDDVVHSCAHQRLFCSEACVAAWLDRHDQQRGYVMDLATLWRLARGWYSGRLERGYRRREPAEAAEYFTSVGLRGPFWGLPE
jgi:hypothetical protein